MRLVVESHADPVLVTRKFVGCSHSSLCCHSCWKEIDNRDNGYNFYNFLYTSFVAPAPLVVEGRAKPLLTGSVAVARIFLIRKVAGLKCFA